MLKHRTKRFKLLAKLLLLVSIVLVTANSSFAAPAGTVLIPANNQNINYFGRFDMSTPEAPRVSWSGAIIEASFPGPVIGMKMEHQNSWYDIEIDGLIEKVVSCGSETQFIFFDDLSDDLHTVRIILRSENHYAAGTFSGLYLAAGKELAAPPATPSRSIEFIGDSYTAGYGVESTGRSCSSEQLNQYTNANKTFAALVTRAFHAQSIILGWSGAGVVRNYGAAGKRSEDPYPTYYNTTLGDVWDSPEWDFSSFIPDLVVINLGTNDYSTEPVPDDSMYIGDYHKFIARILGNYPDASILCISTGDANFQKNAQKVVAEETGTLGHPKVYFASYPSSLNLNGCDWHPDIADNQKVAKVLIDTIMKKLEWDTAAPVNAALPRTIGKRVPNVSLSAVRSGNLLRIATSVSSGQNAEILLGSLSGRVLHRRKTDANGTCNFNLTHLQPGIYIAGNRRCGWVRIPVR
ncbi:MAG: hypothetical protein JW863_13605 [Chitinispirillaceae bacterium]|nr:hypothetical protein [Chitinispirillaceae bacterium]